MNKRWYWWFGICLVIMWGIYDIILFNIWRFPLMIAEDPLRGSIYVVSNFSVLVLGIWLMTIKRKQVAQ